MMRSRPSVNARKCRIRTPLGRGRLISLGALLLALPVGALEAPRPLAGGLTVDPGYMLDPIVITAPRRKVPKTKTIDPRINATLLRLLRQRSELRPEDIGAQNTATGVLSTLATLTGHKLRTRYTELGFLLTEGLAGVTDFQLQRELETTARTGKNPQIRAAAMVALAYTKDERFLTIFQNAMLDVDITVRFGALESLIVLGGPAAEFSIADAARGEASLPLRVMAASAYWKNGNPAGREILLQLAENADWHVRGSAIHALGERGGRDEYHKLMLYLGREQNPIVKAELVQALIRLEKYK